MLFDSIILAGGKPSPLAEGLPNKTFIKINEKPLFVHVLLALQKAKSLRRIFLLGPKVELEMELARLKKGELDHSRVEVRNEDTPNVVENIWRTFLYSLDGYKEGDEILRPELAGRAIFLASGDTPLITHYEVEQFLRGCDLRSYDYFMGMTPNSILDHFHPAKNRPGIKLAYTHFAEGLLRINNMHLVKPFKVANRSEFQEMYNLRHMRDFRNVLKCGVGLLKRHLTLDDMKVWFSALLAMYCRKAGMVRISDYFRKGVGMARAEDIAGRLLGTKPKIVITTIGGSALDIDRKKNISVIERNYQYWMESQLAFTKAAFPEPDRPG